MSKIRIFTGSRSLEMAAAYGRVAKTGEIAHLRRLLPRSREADPTPLSALPLQGLGPGDFVEFFAGSTSHTTDLFKTYSAPVGDLIPATIGIPEGTHVQEVSLLTDVDQEPVDPLEELILRHWQAFSRKDQDIPHPLGMHRVERIGNLLFTLYSPPFTGIKRICTSWNADEEIIEASEAPRLADDSTRNAYRSVGDKSYALTGVKVSDHIIPSQQEFLEHHILKLLAHEDRRLEQQRVQVKR